MMNDGASDTGPTPATPIPRWAEFVVRMMDEAVPIPGTDRRIGLDAVLGFVLPGVGDALTAVSAVALIILGFTLRVPGIVLARMGVNVGVDALTGAIPLMGDLFDVGWKANRRNLALIQRFQRPGARATGLDYLFVTGVLVAALFVALLPILVLGWLLGRVVGAG